jgi:phage/plasmid primase-like uncharacterized protein
MLYPIDQFRDAMRAAGYEPPAEIRPGKIERFSVNGKRSDTAGFCKMFEDMRGGIFGDFREGVTHTWQAENPSNMTATQRKEFSEQIEQAKRERAAEEQRLQAEARQRAAEIWKKIENQTPANDNPYLVRKGVKAYGVRESKGALVVPVKDNEGTLHGLQFIDGEGNKKFLRHTSKQGHYSGIGKPDGCIYIAEGYATAATIYEATNQAVAIAFDAGNLMPVAQALRQRFPDLPIIIAADNDTKTPGNPGMTKAAAAAKAVGGRVVAPDEGDFNDMALALGFDAVAERLMQLPAVIANDNDHQLTVLDPAQAMIEEWVFVAAQRKFVHKPTMRMVDVDAFNMEHLHLMEHFPQYRKMKPAEYMRRIENSEVVHDLMYLPTMWNGDPIFYLDNIKYLNTYNDSSVPTPDPNWQQHDAWQICMAHIQNILPHDWEQLLHWMAHNVQHPGKKILWAPVIVGMPGDGKTATAKMLASAMGRKHSQVVGTQALHSEFNGWAEGKCLSIFEEIRVPGHSRHDFMNKLKTLITNDVVDVVAKGKNSKNVMNTQNYIALSNFRDALALDPDDRRWGVFFTRFKSRDEVTSQMDEEYWARLNDYAVRDHPEVIRGWLLSIDVSNFDRNAGPKMTQAKQYMIGRSMSADAQSIQAILETGARGVSMNVVETKSLNVALRDMENRTIQTSRMSAALAELKFEKVNDVIKWDGRKCHVWVRKPFEYDGSSTSKAAIREELDANEPLPPFMPFKRSPVSYDDQPF